MNASHGKCKVPITLCSQLHQSNLLLFPFSPSNILCLGFGNFCLVRKPLELQNFVSICLCFHVSFCLSVFPLPPSSSPSPSPPPSLSVSPLQFSLPQDLRLSRGQQTGLLQVLRFNSCLQLPITLI